MELINIQLDVKYVIFFYLNKQIKGKMIAK